MLITLLLSFQENPNFPQICQRFPDLSDSQAANNRIHNFSCPLLLQSPFRGDTMTLGDSPGYRWKYD